MSWRSGFSEAPGHCPPLAGCQASLERYSQYLLCPGLGLCVAQPQVYKSWDAPGMGGDPREVACKLRDRSVTCGGCTLRDLPVGIQCISAICRLSLQTQLQLEGSLQSGRSVGLAGGDGASPAGTQGPSGLSEGLYRRLDSMRRPGPWLLAAFPVGQGSFQKLCHSPLHSRPHPVVLWGHGTPGLPPPLAFSKLLSLKGPPSISFGLSGQSLH